VKKINSNNVWKVLLAVSVIVMIAGYVQLNNSVLWGLEKVSEYMREKTQGSLDTTQYNIMLQGFIEQFKWSGIILLSLGGLAFITCIFSLLFNNRSD
jgi:hypothetical protein